MYSHCTSYRTTERERLNYKEYKGMCVVLDDVLSKLTKCYTFEY